MVSRAERYLGINQPQSSEVAPTYSQGVEIVLEDPHAFVDAIAAGKVGEVGRAQAIMSGGIKDILAQMDGKYRLATSINVFSNGIKANAGVLGDEIARSVGRRVNRRGYYIPQCPNGTRFDIIGNHGFYAVQGKDQATTDQIVIATSFPSLRDGASFDQKSLFATMQDLQHVLDIAVRVIDTQRKTPQASALSPLVFRAPR